MSQIPLIDVKAQYAPLIPELEARFREVLDGGQFIRGPHYWAFQEEAAAYLEHPLLGPRLVEVAEALLALPTRDPEAVLGGVDAMKLRSSMTLFAQVQGAAPAFTRVLDEFYAGVADERTERRLRAGTG